MSRKPLVNSNKKIGKAARVLSNLDSGNGRNQSPPAPRHSGSYGPKTPQSGRA